MSIRRRQRPETAGAAELPDESRELIEVMDLHDRPVAAMSIAEAHRQSLPHRSVLVLVHDRQGRLYLQKRSRAKTRYPGRWDVSVSGHVRAGESREDAARRELHEELGLRLDTLKRWQDIPASAENGFEFVTLFSAGRVDAEPSPNPAEISEGAFLDREELSYLVREFRESLTPWLIFFWERGLLFPSSRLD